MASLSSGRAGARRGGGRASAGRGERQSVVQAMRAASRGRGKRSPAFEVTTGVPSAPASLQQLLKQARASGSLNLTSKGLEEVPGQVFNLLGEARCQVALHIVKQMYDQVPSLQIDLPLWNYHIAAVADFLTVIRKIRSRTPAGPIFPTMLDISIYPLVMSRYHIGNRQYCTDKHGAGSISSISYLSENVLLVQ